MLLLHVDHKGSLFDIVAVVIIMSNITYQVTKKDILVFKISWWSL